MGILGGTFNPPHIGHLAIAQRARAELGLAEVRLIPAARAPHKAADPDPGVEHRVAMCMLLIADASELSVSTIEAERGGTSYTVETLRSIHASSPDIEMTLIAGADSARTMPGWREAMALFELADVAVAAREGIDRASVAQALQPLLGGARLQFLGAPPLEVSSSLARALAARGEPLEGVVGERVAQYIGEHGLYRTQEAAP